MIKVHSSVVGQREIQQLLDFFAEHDEWIDDRGDVVSKNFNWKTLPEHIVITIVAILNKSVGNFDMHPEDAILFYDSKLSFRLHVDAKNYKSPRIGKNVLIPLYTDGPCTTIVFDNHWHNGSTRFNKTQQSVFEYKLLNYNNEFVTVPDIRIVRDNFVNTGKCDYNVTLEQLNHIIEMRKHNSDTSTSDYSQVVNYKPDSTFDAALHEQYLKHVPIINLHGLTMFPPIYWRPGDVIEFDRSHLHSAGYGHTRKIGITIFLD